MIVNPTDYLDEDKIKEICEDEIRRQVHESIRNEESINRIVSNMAYRIVFDACNEKTGEDMLEVIEGKVPEIVNDLSKFSVFRAPDAWDKEASKGWTYLQEALDGAKPLIEKKVAELVSQITLRDVQDAFDNSIENAMRRSILPGNSDE